MFITFHAFSRLERPALYVWREGGSGAPVPLISDDRASGWSEFRATIDAQLPGRVFFKLVGRDAEDKLSDWENDSFNRELLRDAGSFPGEVWVFHGARRVVTTDPELATQTSVRVHLITRNQYRDGQLFLWDGDGGNARIGPVTPEEIGPVFDVPLTGLRRQFFYFKFVKRGPDGTHTVFEPDVANRVFVAADGDEIWVHSDADLIRPTRPEFRELKVHFHRQSGGLENPEIHFWQPGSGWDFDAAAEPEAGRWTTHRVPIYADLEYRMKARYRRPGGDWWESDRAVRTVTITGDEERWTVEGDAALFTTQPAADFQMAIRLAARPAGGFAGPLAARVKVRDAGGFMADNLLLPATGEVSFVCFRGLHYRLDYFGPDGSSVSAHDFETPGTGAGATAHAVLTRSTILREAPPANLFTDPPFTIRRPGVRQQGTDLEFVLHVRDAARARLVGPWTAAPIEMLLTNDGAFFWARVPVAQVADGFPEGEGDYHGAPYRFLMNDDWFIHDPAALWVEGSAPGLSSLLFNPARHVWQSDSWQRPGWEYLIIYQLHPARFSGRNPALSPLLQVAREIDQAGGHLRDLGVTAIQLLPVSETSSPVFGWGYDPVFFYAIEHNYGTPADLQELVDAAHAHGMAVILDVEINHLGNSDNILWTTARETFVDGDTQWGPLVNFDGALCRFFFAEHLRYLAETFRIDGFRFDHTDTIINGHFQRNFVRQAGSGGGWDFLFRMRDALKAVDSRCIMIAEELPNDWALTNYGPMDSQWCDNFHDRMVDVCRRRKDVFELGEAMLLSHTACDQWYHVTNYAESHDEVGNEDNRIANCAEFGSGLRLTKVALTAVLLGRGLPHVFMGGEAGETRQFAKDKFDVLPLDSYRDDAGHRQVLAWFQTLCGLRRDDSRVKGPSPLSVNFRSGDVLTFSRGNGQEFFVVLNFGRWSQDRSLAELGLPDGLYLELWNSTWPAFAAEFEDEHTNGGRDARLHRGLTLHVPDFGAVILLRV